jgi:hypothetical protein
MKAIGHGFELLSELQIEVWAGDAAAIRTKRVRREKTDRQDAQLILKPILKDGFPKIWVPRWESRDLPSRLRHLPYTHWRKSEQKNSSWSDQRFKSRFLQASREVDQPVETTCHTC